MKFRFFFKLVNFTFWPVQHILMLQNIKKRTRYLYKTHIYGNIGCLNHCFSQISTEYEQFLSTEYIVLRIYYSTLINGFPVRFGPGTGPRPPRGL